MHRKLTTKVLNKHRYLSTLDDWIAVPGVVPKSKGKMAEEGTHEEGPGKAGA